MDIDFKEHYIILFESLRSQMVCAIDTIDRAIKEIERLETLRNDKTKTNDK